MKRIFFLAYLCATFVLSAQIDSCACSGVCYTDVQDVNCLQCLQNEIHNLNKIENLQIQKLERIDLISDQKIEITDLKNALAETTSKNEKLERSNGRWRATAGVAIAIVFVETVVLFIK